MNALALADTTHSVSSLRIISEHHVLADGDDGTCGGTLLDVDTGGVNLIEEGKSAECRMRLNMIKNDKSALRTNLLTIGMPH